MEAIGNKSTVLEARSEVCGCCQKEGLQCLRQDELDLWDRMQDEQRAE